MSYVRVEENGFHQTWNSSKEFQSHFKKGNEFFKGESKKKKKKKEDIEAKGWLIIYLATLQFTVLILFVYLLILFFGVVFNHVPDEFYAVYFAYLLILCSIKKGY
jgi:hypothetical protein